MGRQRISPTPAAADALRVLGQQIRLARHNRVWTMAELGARAGVSENTVRAIENGSATPSVGNVFNVAVAAGVPLFNASRDELDRLARDGAARLALLPTRVDEPRRKDTDDDFDF